MQLINALISVSGQIAPDTVGMNDEEIAELCVDANRMEMFGFPEEQNEVIKLIREFNYDEFLKEAACHVCKY